MLFLYINILLYISVQTNKCVFIILIFVSLLFNSMQQILSFAFKKLTLTVNVLINCFKGRLNHSVHVRF